MRRVTIQKELAFPLDIVWRKMSDIHSYPQFVTFMKSVEVPGKIQKGLLWYDTTTICIIPLRISHVITKWDVKKGMEYDLIMPLAGKQLQRITIEKTQKGTLLSAYVTFSFANPIVDAILGPILQRQLNTMLATTVVTVENQLKEEQERV